MTAPWDQQVALAALLTERGHPTLPEAPTKYTPPVRYVLPSGPWIASGQTLGSWRARLLVACVVPKGDSSVQMDQLGAMVRGVILALKGSDFTVDAEAVDQPAEMSEGRLGAAVNISTGISRAQFEEEPAP